MSREDGDSGTMGLGPRGVSAHAKYWGDLGLGFIPEDWREQPPELQRACYCSSQYEEMILECGACIEAYGGDESALWAMSVTRNATVFREAWSEYHGVDATPMEDGFRFAPGSHAQTETSSSPLGNATEVSLYYKPSISSGYTVALPTASSNVSQTHANAWYYMSSLSTLDGEIIHMAVATQSAVVSSKGNDESSDATASSGSTTTAGAGAMQTAMAFS
jgi:hypothetical protein